MIRENLTTHFKVEKLPSLVLLPRPTTTTTNAAAIKELLAPDREREQRRMKRGMGERERGRERGGGREREGGTSVESPQKVNEQGHVCATVRRPVQ